MTVRIVDATLREGAQAPGVTFTPGASVDVARLLSRLGVDTIECGHPYAGEAELARVRAVLDAKLPPPLLVHARARVEDIDAAAAAGAPWVGLFRGVNPISLQARVPSDLPHPLGQIEEAIARAKWAGLSVRFTLEDASRTTREDAARVYDAAAAAGADRLCWADTVGAAEPAEVASSVAWMRERYPAFPVEVHLHDDRGLAMANALAAIDAGAEWISTSAIGLGERCGITDLLVLLPNLAARGTREWPDPAALRELASLVSGISGAPPDARRPVVGRHAFTHTAKLHVKAMRRDPAAYSWIDPAKVGRTPEA